jgi:hypothetical protein
LGADHQGERVYRRVIVAPNCIGCAEPLAGRDHATEGGVAGGL